MEKFKAQSPDLILELTTLGDKELTLKPAFIMNAENVKKIINRWIILDKQEETDKPNPIDLIAEQLGFIYPKDKAWFLENFDVGTLNRIMMHVAGTLGELKKNMKNSE